MTFSESTHLLTVRDLKALDSHAPQAFEGVFLLRKAAEKTARNGSAYMMVELGDNTGSFAFTAFSDSQLFNICQLEGEGVVIRIAGTTDYYQERLSPKVHQAQVVSQEELDRKGWLSRLVECSLEDPEAMWTEFQDFIASIKNEGLRQTVETVFQEIGDIFKVSTAAISMHHAYRHGLLEHTLHMARAAKALLPLYKEVHPDLAIAGILLHDTGKAIEYANGLVAKKTRTGILNGHVVLGYRMARKAGMQTKLDPELLERLEHIILSHQGELEWGAAAMAATPEAVFVSMVDNLDARMGVVQYALRHAIDEKEFSEYSPALKSSILTTSI